MCKKRMLIASHHARLMMSMRILLANECGFMQMVSDYDSLYDAVECSRYDIVIADLSMIYSSGKSVIHFLQRMSSQSAIILLSHHDAPAIVSECLAAGARGVVLQPAAATDLVPAVEAVLKGDVYISPRLSRAGVP